MKIRRPDDFEYRCGDYIYVNIPDVARFEWHPFTISSAPEDQGENDADSSSKNESYRQRKK